MAPTVLPVAVLTRQVIEHGSEGGHVRGRRKERKEPVKMGEYGFNSALINNFLRNMVLELRRTESAADPVILLCHQRLQSTAKRLTR